MSQTQTGLGPPPFGGSQRIHDRQKPDSGSMYMGLSASVTCGYGSRVIWGNGSQLCLPQLGLHKGGCSSPSGDHRRELCVGTYGHRGQNGKTSTEHGCLSCSRRNHRCCQHKTGDLAAIILRAPRQVALSQRP